MFLLYRLITILAYPIFIFVIFFRKILNKEHPIRYKEKIFKSSLNNSFDSSGKVIWFHGASMGEIKSIFPIVKYFLKKNERIKILLTSGTVTSSKLVEKEFKNFDRVQHKFFPVDVPILVRNFINTFKPSSAIFIDSELWPNFISELKKKNIPLILLNARITQKSFNKWMFVKKFAKKILSSFDVCLLSNLNTKNNLEKLQLSNLKYFGNLKYIFVDENKPVSNPCLEKIKGHKKIWLAASTHDGEEIFCVKVHNLMKNKLKNILTIIVPRHINRVEKIRKKIEKFGLNVQILGEKDIINDKADIILINQIGTINEYYKYCKNVFIGKSINKKLAHTAGQNPLEAVRNGCKIYHGPYVYNFQDIYNYLKDLNVSFQINDENELAGLILKSFNKDEFLNNDKIKKIDEFGKDIFIKTVKELEKFI